MTHPIDEYVMAVTEYQSGNKEEAERYLASSLGSKTVTQPIKDNFERLIDKNTTAHKTILPLIVNECRKRG